MLRAVFRVGMFNIQSICQEARAGVFKTAHGDIQTPAYIVPSSRGAVPYLIPDLLKETSPAAVQLSLGDIYDLPGPSTIEKHSGGAHGFYQLNCPLIISQRNPLAEGELPASAQTHTYVNTLAGRQAVTPESYSKLLASFKPDIAVTLADEVKVGTKAKRAKTSQERTIKWMDESLERKVDNVSLFGVVVGTSAAQRVECAKIVNERQGLAGFAMGGLCLGETPEVREAMVLSANKCLDPQKPRMMFSSSILDTLQAVTLGADFIQCSYPFDLAEGALALGVPFASYLPSSQEQTQPAPLTATPTSDQPSTSNVATLVTLMQNGMITLNLRDNKLARDPLPLVPGCKCYACTRHTRAYIHHLVAAHEMLGDTLLATHNLYQYQELFRVLRQAVQQNALPEFVARLKKEMQPPAEDEPTTLGFSGTSHVVLPE